MDGNFLTPIDWDLASKYIPAILSFFGALAGTWLGFGKFKKERHWQEKTAAYEKILLALESLSHWGEVSFRNAHCDYFIGDHLTDADKDYKVHIREIYRLKSIGNILFSKHFYNVLERCIEEINTFDAQHAESMLGEQPDHYTGADYSGRVGAIASRYLEQMQQIAQRDIGQTTWWKISAFVNKHGD